MVVARWTVVPTLRTLALSFFFLIALGLCSSTVHAGKYDQRYEFQISETTLGKAIDALVRQTNVLVLYPYELANTGGMKPVVGRYTIDEAFRIMLRDTPFSGGLTKNGVLTIALKGEEMGAGNTGAQGSNEMSSNKLKNGLLATVSALLFGTGDSLAADNASDLSLEEIVVTAQRRSESLQDVSIAISAFTGEAISKLGTNNLKDLTEHISGVELFDDRGAGQPTWIIRGVGLADFNSNNTPTAAIYYDEYYLTSNVLGGIGLFDIGSVEVLKGPQGGLYGRNTSGGAVRVNSKAPMLGEDFNGYAKLSYGKWGRGGGELAVGGSLSDRVAYRLSGMVDQGGGWQDSLVTAQDDKYGDADFWAVRGQILAKLSDAVDMKIKIEGGQNKSETTLGYSRALFDPATGDFCASAFAGASDENNCITWYNFTSLVTDGELGLSPADQSDDGSVVLSKPINRLDDDWIGVNVQLDADLGFATLTSITGYLDYTNRQIFDFDASPLTLFEEDGRAALTSWSQELRLISATEGPFSWVAGAMYAHDTDDEFRYGDLTDNVLIFSSRSYRNFTQKTESWAIYGQADYRVTDAVKLHGSLRYTDETKKYLDGNFYDITNDFYNLKDVNQSTKLKAHWSGHIGVDWSPVDDTLFYVRATKGFKSGGFFGGFATAGEDQVTAYKEETVYSYEAGLKTDLLDKTVRLNAAAYIYDYRDVQGFTEVIGAISQTVVTKLDNIGDAKHKGVEADLTFAPRGIPGLVLQGSLSWLNAKYTNSDTVGLDPSGVPVPVEGLKRTFAPKWSYGLQGSYERDISETLRAGVQLNYSWRDNIADTSTQGTLLSLAAYRHDSYGVLNGRIFVATTDDKWELALAAHNLTNKHYLLRATGDDLLSYSSFYAKPTSYTLTLTAHW